MLGDMLMSNDGPIGNAPDVAILGLTRSKMAPVWLWRHPSLCGVSPKP